MVTKGRKGTSYTFHPTSLKQLHTPGQPDFKLKAAAKVRPVSPAFQRSSTYYYGVSSDDHLSLSGSKVISIYLFLPIFPISLMNSNFIFYP